MVGAAPSPNVLPVHPAAIATDWECLCLGHPCLHSEMSGLQTALLSAGQLSFHQLPAKQLLLEDKSPGTKGEAKPSSKFKGEKYLLIYVFTSGEREEKSFHPLLNDSSWRRRGDIIRFCWDSVIASWCLMKLFTRRLGHPQGCVAQFLCQHSQDAAIWQLLRAHNKRVGFQFALCMNQFSYPKSSVLLDPKEQFCSDPDQRAQAQILPRVK